MDGGGDDDKGTSSTMTISCAVCVEMTRVTSKQTGKSCSGVHLLSLTSTMTTLLLAMLLLAMLVAPIHAKLLLKGPAPRTRSARTPLTLGTTLRTSTVSR
jgi:hypothetical protein